MKPSPLLTLHLIAVRFHLVSSELVRKESFSNQNAHSLPEGLRCVNNLFEKFVFFVSGMGDSRAGTVTAKSRDNLFRT